MYNCWKPKPKSFSGNKPWRLSIKLQYVFNCSEKWSWGLGRPTVVHLNVTCHADLFILHSGSEILMLSICSNPPINITLIATVNRNFYLQSENKAHVAINVSMSIQTVAFNKRHAIYVTSTCEFKIDRIVFKNFLWSARFMTCKHYYGFPSETVNSSDIKGTIFFFMGLLWGWTLHLASVHRDSKKV